MTSEQRPKTSEGMSCVDTCRAMFQVEKMGGGGMHLEGVRRQDPARSSENKRGGTEVGPRPGQVMICLYAGLWVFL